MYKEKKDIDWKNLGFSYMSTDKRYVSHYKMILCASMNVQEYSNTVRSVLKDLKLIQLKKVKL